MMSGMTSGMMWGMGIFWLLVCLDPGRSSTYQISALLTDRNMTGPSLANLWGRKAGSLPSFERYSEALKASGIIWDDRSLDGWLTDPDRMVPDNEMPFNGIKDTRVRADLLAFLKDATKPGPPQQTAQQGGMKGMMGGMMGGGPDPNLKKLEPGIEVKSISYCRDTYRVTTADGKTRAFWERNLRFRTDSSKDGATGSATPWRTPCQARAALHSSSTAPIEITCA